MDLSRKAREVIKHGIRTDSVLFLVPNDKADITLIGYHLSHIFQGGILRTRQSLIDKLSLLHHLPIINYTVVRKIVHSHENIPVCSVHSKIPLSSH